MTQTIVITSGKGGVGKTNISVNTAIELARRNYRTCLFDADLGLANVNILLGIDPDYTLDDYIFGDRSLDDIILKTRFGIDVIPGSSGIEKMANLEREEITRLIAAFSRIQGYDYFLIDTSSGISRGVIAFCLAGNETILVITSEATSLTDAYAVLKVMALNNYTGTVKILVNKRPSIPQARQTYLRFKEVVNRHLEIDIAPAGIILNDPNIEAAVTQQEPFLTLFPDSSASQCIAAMVSNLLDDTTTADDDDDLSKFWQRYFEHSLPDSPETATPADQRSTGGSCRSAEPEEDNSSVSAPPLSSSATLPIETPPEVRPVVPPEVQPEVQPEVTPITADEPQAVHLGQDQAEKEIPSMELTADSIIPFAENGGIFELSNLAGPVPLLIKALELQSRGEMTQETLLDIFSCDPILLAKALKMLCGKKATAGQTNRITTKSQLVEELGREALTNILSATIMQRALMQQVPPATTDLAAVFWVHSYQCAVLSEEIAKMVAYPFPEEAFMAGLIHDIGRLALQLAHPEAYARYPGTFDHEHSLLEMEQRLFGMHHAEAGAKALSAWNLDSFLIDAIRYHTEPVSRIETAFSLVKIVFLACRLARLPEENDEICRLGEEFFELSPDQLHKLVAKANRKTGQLAERYHIPFSGRSKKENIEEAENRFRLQVMEYSILQGVLPCSSPGRELQETIRSVFQAFDILFNFQPALCLMPDQRQTALKFVEFPGCFGLGILSDIEFSLTWAQSLVVQSFISGNLRTTMEGKNSTPLSLADNQLLNSLGSQGFVCVPMIAHKICRGIIVFGVSERELDKISSWQIRLEQFGVQAAGNIYSLSNLEN